MSTLPASAAARANSSIEFVVVPKDDLFLEGGIRKLFRVTKGTAYPCQMQKTQNFSCLFRHYAKHNGLRKEDLVFYFTDELQQDQTPESVHLMPQDEIWVQHLKRNESNTEKKQLTSDHFTDHLRKLLRDEHHFDVTFQVGSDKISGHKALLSARSEYFEAMFRKEGGLSESSQSLVNIHGHDISTFKRVLEFIYTNSIQDLNACDADDTIALLVIADEYMMEDLKLFCSSYVDKVLSVDNVGKFMSLCSTHRITEIRELCIKFVRNHHPLLRQNPYFCAEVEQYPELGLLLLDALPATSGNIGNSYSSDNIGVKRARIDESMSERTHEIPSQSMSSNTIQNNSFVSDGM